eukprot:TRINITY_DN11320_c0_g1_i1.p2 TRINITY_DN11320_c0_g1~~TRINITY_DN11320_c0_g1_i1.p2  ORF type:complete len:229 (+),score=76.66 TRINITY_DN11320_c0_g1_i1:77-763(+)
MADDAEMLVRRALREPAGIEIVARALAMSTAAMEALQEMLAEQSRKAAPDAPSPADSPCRPVLPPQPTARDLELATEEAIIAWLAAVGERAVRQAEADQRKHAEMSAKEKEARYGSVAEADQTTVGMLREIAEMRAVVALCAGRCWARAYERFAALDERARERFPDPFVSVLATQRQALDEQVPAAEAALAASGSTRGKRGQASPWRHLGPPLHETVSAASPRRGEGS